MKKVTKSVSLFLAFCMLFTAIQVVFTPAAVKAAIPNAGDEPYATADINNGSKYIYTPSTGSFHAIAFELFQPLRGTGTSEEANAPTNAISFDVTVLEMPGGDNAFIAFNPMERVVTGGNTRPWAIMMNTDGSFYVRNAGNYVNTGVAFEIGASYGFEVVFNFEDYSYTVSIDGEVVAEDFAISGGIESDGEGRNIAALPTNMGIISVASPAKGAFEMRNISAGIVNLVDNDATKNMNEVNPVVNADGTKTYLVGPKHKFQKAQDVFFMLEAGDVVEIEGDNEYPAAFHYSTGVGLAAGTEDAPITFRGKIVNGKRPVIRSAGAVNVVEINASFIVLENLDVTGQLYRTAEVRGFEDGTAFANAYPERNQAEQKTSFRGIYFSGGGNYTIKNCAVHGNYQGIQSAAIGSLTIDASEIYDNGLDPYGHNIYIETVDNGVLTVTNSYIHDTVVYRNNGLKSRAWKNIVMNNVFENCEQAMELIGPGNVATPRDSEVMGNLIVNCRQGMRLGGDGTGPGTRGRYRVLNNTYAYLGESDATFMRAHTDIESIELYNNLIYSATPLAFWYHDSARWVSGTRITGANNWVTPTVGSNPVPAMVSKVIGAAGSPFVDAAAGDFRLNGDSDAGRSVLAMKASALTTVYAGWDLVNGRDSKTFVNPITELVNEPVNKVSFANSKRVDGSNMLIGAYSQHTAITAPIDEVVPEIPEVPVVSGAFTDVMEGDSFYTAVEFCAEEGIFLGFGKSAFRPNDVMTNAMFLTVLYRVAGSPVVDGDAAGTYYADALNWAVAMDVVAADDFDADAAISTQDLADLLPGIASKPGVVEAAQIVLSDAPATRAEAAVIIYNILTFVDRTAPIE